jgi:hypothetical protein
MICPAVGPLIRLEKEIQEEFFKQANSLKTKETQLVNATSKRYVKNSRLLTNEFLKSDGKGYPHGYKRTGQFTKEQSLNSSTVTN